MKLYTELSIEYSHSQDDAASHHLTCFRYTCRELITTTDKKTIQFIYCRSRLDFLELLNHWNRDERWKYVEVR